MNEKLEILKEAGEYIVKLQGGIEHAVQYFQVGKEWKGSELVINIIDGLQWIMQAMALTVDIQKKPINITLMNEKFKEIIEAYENEDYILIGDLFQYEILPILEEYKDIINESLS